MTKIEFAGAFKMRDAKAMRGALAFVALNKSEPGMGHEGLAGDALEAWCKAGAFETEGGVARGWLAPGLGSKQLFAACPAPGDKGMRASFGKVIQVLRESGVSDAAVVLPESAEFGWGFELALALVRGLYAYGETKPSVKAEPLLKISVHGPERVRGEFERGLALGRSINLARHLGDLPPNVATPERLAQAARDIAKRGGAQMKCTVLGEREARKLGMGAFLAVAKGSNVEPRFIEVFYQGGPKNQKPVILVGKGITFDSGGISIKPSGEMDEMKFDMCGAASVLGVFDYLVRVKPRINVVGLIPACENMPDAAAVKPGDVVVSMSGKTIEILNTDAEGRLVLCDALHYAKKFEPAVVIDVATLTGACVVALGAERSGMYANDESLSTELFAAGEASADKCWRMPLDDEYAEGLKSNFADMANIAGRGAGSVTAAKFLQKFVDYPWAHLDIAGTAWRGGPAKGSTGRPVGLLVEFIEARARSSYQEASQEITGSKPKKKSRKG